MDDDAAFRGFLRSTLAFAGYDTAVAADGSTALAAFKQDGPFDVVITDVMMPRMGGSALGRCVRQITSSVKVLYVTGSRSALSSDKPHLSPHEAVVDKPCTPESVLDAVALLVKTPAQPHGVSHPTRASGT